ncbi:sugar transferase [Aeoliella mucimassa]|uniref:sugar transferase n=1 Tax=Aeoliella mucimassa TaxID=2527972 RepID=UPI0018D2AB1B|nr:sugar transferase [Aeoliella mucimassa]
MTHRSAYRGPQVLTAEEFQHAAICERMRVDRNGSVLSVLTIALPARRASARDCKQFLAMLAERLRLTDTVGALADGRFGVLLPDTPESGAWKVAADLCDPFVPGNDRPHCEVVVYPDDQRDNEGFPAPEDSVSGISFSETPSSDAFFALRVSPWKRLFDIVGASAGLVLTSPLIAGAALAVKLTSPGAAFFLQEREGLGGKRFQILKLRTMRSDAESFKDDLRMHSEQDGPAFKMTNDPRVTWVGKWLRKTSIDELPQLWNVLRGEMSLVGPRPLPTQESQECCSWQRQRLQVLPGLTCIWQIRGRNVVSFEEWIRMDLRYIRRRSLWYDLQLVLATVPAIVFSKGPR